MVNAFGVLLGALVVLSIAAIVLYVVLFLVAAVWVARTRPSQGCGQDEFPSSKELDRFLSALLVSAESSVGANGHG